MFLPIIVGTWVSDEPCRYSGAAGRKKVSCWPSFRGFIAENQVWAGTEPPDMPCPAIASSVVQVRIGSLQMDCGRGSESQTMTEVLISGVKPRKADDLYS